MQEKDVNAIKETLLPGYENSFWSCSTTKLGYSGTAIISRVEILYKNSRMCLLYVNYILVNNNDMFEINVDQALVCDVWNWMSRS